MSAPVQRRSSTLLNIIFSIGLLVGAAYVFLHRQQLLDMFTVWQFQPTPAISEIAERASFDDNGRFLFFASQPVLLDRTSFNDACRSQATEHTAILGCYSANRIYLFDIKDQSLDGIKEVTAAHEMLHAAYQRLPNSEKDRVNALLSAQDLGANTDRINSLMKEYARTEPGQEYNELHSIIGSEVRDLSPELETYYASYFEDRLKTVALSDGYQTVFNELRARQDSLVTELNNLADEIDADSATYRRDLQVLENDIQSFNREASSGTMTRTEYETRRTALESQQNSLRRRYNAIQDMIEIYETKRAELAAINTKSNALNRSINSSLTPVPDAIDG